MFSSLVLLISSPISKIPTKNSPKLFFVICWFDDVLLILIHEFALLLVDLAFPQFSPLSIHEISPILPPKSSISAPKIEFLEFILGFGARTSGPWPGHPAPGAHFRARFWTSGPGNPAPTPDVRPLGIQPVPFHRFDRNFHIRSLFFAFFSSLSSY